MLPSLDFDGSVLAKHCFSEGRVRDFPAGMSSFAHYLHLNPLKTETHQDKCTLWRLPFLWNLEAQDLGVDETEHKCDIYFALSGLDCSLDLHISDGSTPQTARG